MVDELGLKGPQRSAMQDLPVVRKRYLLWQNQQMRSSSNIKDMTPQSASPSYSQSYGSASATTLIPRLVPQLTGIFKRFSIVGRGGGGASTSSTPTNSSPLATHSESMESVGTLKTWPMSPVQRAQSPPPQPEVQLLVPQSTGGLWSGRFVGSKPKAAGKPAGDKSKGQTPESHVDGLKLGKGADERLAKHLIRLL